MSLPERVTVCLSTYDNKPPAGRPGGRHSSGLGAAGWPLAPMQQAADHHIRVHRFARPARTNRVRVDLDLVARIEGRQVHRLLRAMRIVSAETS